MSMSPVVTVLYALAGLCLALALLQALATRRRWRARRRLAASHRALWSLVFVLLTLLAGGAAAVLTGWHRLAAEAPVAQVTMRQLGPRHFAVTVRTPDGTRHAVELRGDEWQLDARVIKWRPWAVALGAPPLYRLERIGGRYRDIAMERSMPRSVAALSAPGVADAWQLERRFPRWLPWIDADYGSAAYLPMVDGGAFTVTLAAAGGLVARPADAATAARLQATGF